MTDEEKLNDEHWLTMHILSMSGRSTIGLCKERCVDPCCDYGCLQQSAKQFRPQIMHGIKYLREQGSDRFPLTAEVVYSDAHKCKGGDLGKVGTRDTYCKDPVCRVSGCLNRPAFQFRELIKIAAEQEIMNALKK
jgi:hypothetical protein